MHAAVVVVVAVDNITTDGSRFGNIVPLDT